MQENSEKLKKILYDLLIYEYPNLAKDKELTLSNPDKDKLERYQQFITGISQIYLKIGKYPLYFKKLYPANSEISKAEVLKYHIHSYLQDLTILKNRLTGYLGGLKSDLKKVVENKEEVEDALKWLKQETQNVFNEVAKYRNSHQHGKLEFTDQELIKLLGLSTIKNEFSELKLTPEYKEKLDKNFIELRQKRVKQSKTNFSEITGLVDDILGRTEKWLYIYLDIRSVYKKS